MGMIALDGYYNLMTVLLVIGVIFIVFGIQSFKKNRNILTAVCLLITILSFLCAFNLYIEVEEIKRDYVRQEYEFQLNITPSNNTTYKMLFPIPDNKILNDHDIIGNATLLINVTMHGMALDITSKEGIIFQSNVRNANSIDLSMREDDLYYIYKWSDFLNDISVSFIYDISGSDWVSTQIFQGLLLDGWDFYEINHG